MTEAASYVAFFGDAERQFRLTPDLITELERKAGQGIGLLSRRLFQGDFRHADLLEIVRLGLIGGGEPSQVASSLVRVYIEPRPVMEAFALAVAIVETLMFGRATPHE